VYQSYRQTQIKQNICETISTAKTKEYHSTRPKFRPIPCAILVLRLIIHYTVTQNKMSHQAKCNFLTKDRAFADMRGYLIEFITDNNLAYAKPALIRDKQHYVCSENAL